MKNYSTIFKCRLCSSRRLSKLFSLGNLYISTFVKKPGRNIGRAPLELVWCNKCTLVQLKHTAKQELLYSGNYWYESGLNKIIVNDLKNIVRIGLRMVKYKIGDCWLDLGANDGTLLSFIPRKWVRIGVEPAKNLYPIMSRHADIKYNSFWNSELLTKHFEATTGRFDMSIKIISAIGMFYDMDDPGQFVRDVTKVLHKDGIFIAQLMTAKQMLEKNDVGNICHEHIEYYSYKSLVYLFEKNGLEIFKVEENDINGGSYRLYARHFRKGSVRHAENVTKKAYKDFYRRIQQNRDNCVKFIEKCKEYGEKVYAYGASTKGNTILQWFGFTKKDIVGVAEIHPNKIGKFTVGSNIPIIKEDEVKEKADWFLILPFAFKDSFIKRNKNWLASGGKFIFSTPKFEIYAK